MIFYNLGMECQVFILIILYLLYMIMHGYFWEKYRIIFFSWQE